MKMHCFGAENNLLQTCNPLFQQTNLLKPKDVFVSVLGFFIGMDFA